MQAVVAHLGSLAREGVEFLAVFLAYGAQKGFPGGPGNRLSRETFWLNRKNGFNRRAQPWKRARPAKAGWAFFTSTTLAGTTPARA